MLRRIRNGLGFGCLMALFVVSGCQDDSDVPGPAADNEMPSDDAASGAGAPMQMTGNDMDDGSGTGDQQGSMPEQMQTETMPDEMATETTMDDMMGDGAAVSASIAGGPFSPLAGYETSEATGFALIERLDAGAEITLQVSGLSPSMAYGAHLHALPCALSGGGHYKIDPSVVDTVEGNEIWPAFETDEKGAAVVELSSEHRPREDGMSVVVHDPAADNAKMLCADLVFGSPPDPDPATGVLWPFAGAELLDQSLIGKATLTRSATGTTVDFEVSGVQETETYVAHVHTLPCEVNEAGGHYKLDPSMEETVETNELWIQVELQGELVGTGAVTSDQLARPDAQSVVLHRNTMDGSAKVGCLDLERDRSQDFVTSGSAVLLEGAPMGLSASATMRRMSSGSTNVSVKVEGATPDTEHAVHVHDRPCAVEAGGGHYKFDRSMSDTVEANEVWLPVTTDSAGAGASEIMVPDLLRADAEAIVIHGAEGVRLACIELAVP